MDIILFKSLKELDEFNKTRKSLDDYIAYYFLKITKEGNFFQGDSYYLTQSIYFHNKATFTNHLNECVIVELEKGNSKIVYSVSKKEWYI